MERLRIQIKKEVLKEEFQEDRIYWVVSTFWVFDIQRFPFIHRAYKTIQGDKKYPTFTFYGRDIEKML